MEITDKYLNKIAAHPIQTSYWADFRGKWGNKILKTKYGLITIHKLPFTKFQIGMFIKGGVPTQTMLTDLKKIAVDNNLIFIKLEPNTKKSSNLVKLLSNNSAVPGKTLFTPTSFWVDLTKSEDDLLKSFHSKTRYNIRLAAKRGVVVSEDNSAKAFDDYIRLKRETVERQGFYDHSEKYHRQMWQVLREADIAHLLVAKYNNEIITAWVLFKWKDFLYYPYGASTDKYKDVMANNLVMWEGILFGKNQNLKTFDLWGREEGKGFTKFKEGFNPEVVEFLGTWDLVINKPLYQLYQILEAIRWITLRFKSKFIKPKF